MAYLEALVTRAKDRRLRGSQPEQSRRVPRIRVRYALVTSAAQREVNLVRFCDHGGHGGSRGKPGTDDLQGIHVHKMHVDLSAPGRQGPEAQLDPEERNFCQRLFGSCS